MAVTRRSGRGRARLLLAVVVLSALVLLINAAGHTAPSRRETVLGYVDQVRPLIERSTEEGASLADVRDKAIQLGRLGIARELDRLAAQTQATLTQVTTITPPGSLRVAHAYLVAAMGVRNKAAQAARPAMTDALSPVPTDTAVKELAAVGQDMQLSDQAFALFSGALPPNTVTPTPTSTWVPDNTVWTESEISVFVTSLRSSTSLTPVHDLAIVTFTTDPPPVGNDNGAIVLPPTRGLQVSIVVANVGNLAERHVTVTATLATVATNTSEMVRDFVDLAPGQRTAITIGSLHPQSGTRGTLTAAVQPVSGETNLANNAQSWTVELR